MFRKHFLGIAFDLPGHRTAALVLGLALVQGISAQPATDPSAPVIFLDQGWTPAERAWYYQVSQGSAVMSWDLFMNLELAGSQELFRGDANSERFGLITQPADAQNNPEALPIGLSKTIVRRKGSNVEDVQIGLTCAACHNAQLNYQGKRIRIDGGVANTFDMMGYVTALDDAMQATLADKAKFDRLATKLGAMSV